MEPLPGKFLLSASDLSRVRLLGGGFLDKAPTCIARAGFISHFFHGPLTSPGWQRQANKWLHQSGRLSGQLGAILRLGPPNPSRKNPELAIVNLTQQESPSIQRQQKELEPAGTFSWLLLVDILHCCCGLVVEIHPLTCYIFSIRLPTSTEFFRGGERVPPATDPRVWI